MVAAQYWIHLSYFIYLAIYLFFGRTKSSQKEHKIIKKKVIVNSDVISGISGAKCVSNNCTDDCTEKKQGKEKDLLSDSGDKDLNYVPELLVMMVRNVEVKIYVIFL